MWQQLHFAWWDGEEQFIVIATVQSEMDALKGAGSPLRRRGYRRKFSQFDERANVTRGTEARQIAGQSIGEVHHCRDKAIVRQPSAKRETRLGIEMLLCQRIAGPRAPLTSSPNPQSQFRLA
jgi:hypothetical protein